LGGACIRVPSLGNPGIPPETSNFYCLPGRAGGTPNVLGERSPLHLQPPGTVVWVQYQLTRYVSVVGLVSGRIFVGFGSQL
jgi:hypothetical protein